MPLSDPRYVAAGDLSLVLTDDNLVRLADDDNDDAADAATVNGYLRAAEATVESYIGGRYGVPIEPVTDQVKWAVLILARTRLYARRGITLTDAESEEQDAVMRWLGDVYAERADLTPEGSTPETEDGAGASAGFGTTINTDFDQPLFPFG